ncbi:MAG: response regulator [Ignavibacteriaceae bacterium]|nr:response regulator [Ignavibacteriaceae bacterium]
MNAIRVLIVDDEEELASIIAERLQFRGMEAHTALEGKKALKLIEENPPSVVVLDLMMPGLGGLEILKRIKTMNYNLPVILLSGYGSKESAKEGMNLGAFDFVMKPCDIDSLISKIQEAVARNN